MEAAGIPGREADVRRLPTDGADARRGLDPGRSRAAGARRLRGHDVRAQPDQLEPGQRQRGRRRPLPWALWRSPTAESPSSLAGMWEFRTGNTFGAVAFMLVRRVLDLVLRPRPVGAGRAFRPSCTRCSAVPVDVGDLHRPTCSSRRCGPPAAVALVFLLLAITFILLGDRRLGAGRHAPASPTHDKLGGYVGIATAIAAWYASFAAVLNSTFGRVVAAGLPAPAGVSRNDHSG